MARKRISRRVHSMQLKLQGAPPTGDARRANIEFRDYIRRLRHRHVYDGEPYSGRLLLIFSQESARGRDYPYFVRRWTELAEGIDLHVLPGGHDALASGEGVRRLAALLEDYLSKHDA